MERVTISVPVPVSSPLSMAPPSMPPLFENVELVTVTVPWPPWSALSMAPPSWALPPEKVEPVMTRVPCPPLSALSMAPPSAALPSEKVEPLTFNVPAALSALSMAPPSSPEACRKVEPVTLSDPPALLSTPPPSSPLVPVLRAFSMVTSSILTKASPIVSTGPPQLEVVQPLGLPSLPSRMGLVTPGAGPIVSGADADVPVGLMVQLPM